MALAAAMMVVTGAGAVVLLVLAYGVLMQTAVPRGRDGGAGWR